MDKTNKLMIKKGTMLSRVSYMKVLRSDAHSIEVCNQDGLTWTIDPDIIAEECYSHDQYDEIIDVTRTKLIEIFINESKDSIFTINFNKQAKIKDVIEAATTRDNGKIKSKKDIAKLVKEAEKGEERTLIGHMLKIETGMGRSMVVDLEADTKSNIRQVDHRSINWLILKNIKYVVK